MFGRASLPSTRDDALLEAVTDAVPRGSATIRREWDGELRGWRVSVQPESADACPFAVTAHARDQVRVDAGASTTFEVYGARGRRDLDLVRRLIAAIVAGAIDEYTSRSGSFVRLTLGPRKADVFEGGRRRRWWPGTPKPRAFAPYV